MEIFSSNFLFSLQLIDGFDGTWHAMAWYQKRTHERKSTKSFSFSLSHNVFPLGYKQKRRNEHDKEEWRKKCNSCDYKKGRRQKRKKEEEAAVLASNKKAEPLVHHKTLVSFVFSV